MLIIKWGIAENAQYLEKADNWLESTWNRNPEAAVRFSSGEEAHAIIHHYFPNFCNMKIIEIEK
ncbi:MAG TPA: hypothetical protein DEP23_01610 [Ruminococcaceae bacterium]|nr:hypothetical protein [Oscillospiraceae bacterium]